MISDFNGEESMVNTKNKRDEYIVEIRRKKVSEYITQQRMKLYSGDRDRTNTKIIEEELGNTTNPGKIENLYNQPDNPEINVIHLVFY